MKRVGIVALLLFLAVCLCPSGVQAQSGSYLDTIYQANEQGINTSQEEEIEYPDESEEQAKPLAVKPKTAYLTSKQVSSRISQIIQQILQRIFGRFGNVPIRIRIIRVRCPKPTTTTKQPTVSKPTQTQPTQTTRTNTSTTSNISSSSSSSRAKIYKKHKVDAANADSKWTESQYVALDETLSSLPDYFKSCTTQVRRVKAGPPGSPAGVMGYVRIPRQEVQITDLAASVRKSHIQRYGKEKAIQIAKNNFKRTIVHEMTHTFQGRHADVSRAWQSKFWSGKKVLGLCPTAYGRTQPLEDMAESVATYWIGGAIKNGKFYCRDGRIMDLDRYNFIKKYIMNGKEYRY